MKAHVYVMLRRTVLDPQGQTIQSALKKLQYRGVDDVRQGKYFVLTLDGSLSETPCFSDLMASASVSRSGSLSSTCTCSGIPT